MQDQERGALVALFLIRDRLMDGRGALTLEVELYSVLYARESCDF